MRKTHPNRKVSIIHKIIYFLILQNVNKELLKLFKVGIITFNNQVKILGDC